MPITDFGYEYAKVTDLEPLRGMPLNRFSCGSSPLSDLSTLRDCPGLTFVYVRTTKVSAAEVAALQQALPNCKIDWDDSAKAKTPQPSASGTK